MKKIVLTIAGSDSSGGAGIQADIKTIESHNAFAMSVVTIVTAQNSHDILDIFPISVKNIEAQIEAVFSDYEIHSIKVGALHSGEIIEAVANNLTKYSNCQIVVDPVMIAKSKAILMSPELCKKFIAKFSQITFLITPNLEEASYLTNLTINNVVGMKKAAIAIHNLGFKNVFIKGGHLQSKIITDVLYADKQFYEFHNQQIDTLNSHGTGCTISSAIAALLSQNHLLPEAVKKAISYTHNALKNNLDYGRKHGPLNHFWKE